MVIQAVCFTSDKGLPYIPGFLNQWKKYAGVSVEIVGFTPPSFDLPNFANFISIGEFKNYPAFKWSNAIIEYLDNFLNPRVDQLVIMLEDYWLIRPIDFSVIVAAGRYMDKNQGVLRCDLTTDRVYSGAILRDIPFLRSAGETMDLIETDPAGAYSFSMQAALWNKTLFRWLLRKDESPWDTELIGTKRLSESGLRVIGTRQNPVNYLIACNKGKFDPSGAWMYPPRTLAPEDWKDLFDRGLLPKDTTPEQIKGMGFGG